MLMQTLTPTLSRFAGEGATETVRLYRVPSTAKRERDRVRVYYSVPASRRKLSAERIRRMLRRVAG
jgi:hypothetical protein